MFKLAVKYESTNGVTMMVLTRKAIPGILFTASILVSSNLLAWWGGPGGLGNGGGPWQNKPEVESVYQKNETDKKKDVKKEKIDEKADKNEKVSGSGDKVEVSWKDNKGETGGAKTAVK